jgi:hypothetical protein
MGLLDGTLATPLTTSSIPSLLFVQLKHPSTQAVHAFQLPKTNWVYIYVYFYTVVAVVGIGRDSSGGGGGGGGNSRCVL